MKGLVILLLIIISGVYMGTGRYKQVKANINDEGFVALMEEPFWLADLAREKTQKLMDWINFNMDNSVEPLDTVVDNIKNPYKQENDLDQFKE